MSPPHRWLVAPGSARSARLRCTPRSADRLSGNIEATGRRITSSAKWHAATCRVPVPVALAPALGCDPRWPGAPAGARAPLGRRCRPASGSGERTGSRPVLTDHRRRRAGDLAQPLGAGAVQPGQRSEQAVGVGHGRRVEDLVDRPDLHRRPAYMTSTRSARPAMTPRSWVIRRRAAPVSSQGGPQRAQHLGLHGDVEGGGRLVGQDDGRVVGHGDGDDHPLAHAPGELVGVVAHPLGGDWGCPPSPAARHAWAMASSLLTSWWARTASAICQPTV